ncbi:MAG: MATE family efflux transporter [Burkholderiales bacterium]|nr:MATE family efflux transporter [Burkholderiales bacterium]
MGLGTGVANRTWRHELADTFALGWPLVLANLAQAALTATDVMLMGRLGPDALAAGALASALYHACMIFCMGLVSATLPLVSSALGRRKRPVRDVRHIIHQGLWTALLVCLPMWALLWHTETILLWMGQAPDAARLAATFMHTLQWALLPYLGYLVLRSLLAALGKQRWTLIVAGLAIAVNAVLAWALMFGKLGLPAWGLPGAGMASTLSSAFMCLGLAAVVWWHPSLRDYRLLRHDGLPDPRGLARQWRLGLPIALTFSFETTIFYAAVMMMGMIGPTELAAHAVAIQIASVSFMVPLSFGQVATIRVAKSHAAGTQADGGWAMRRAGWSAFVLGVGFMALMSGVMLTAPHLLLWAFLDLNQPANAAVVAMAAHFLALAALFQVVDGAQAVAAGMLRGLHDTRVPMLLAALGYWGAGIPLSAWFAFGLGWGGTGVWLGLLTGLGATAVLLTRRWWVLSRHGHPT